LQNGIKPVFRSVYKKMGYRNSLFNDQRKNRTGRSLLLTGIGAASLFFIPLVFLRPLCAKNHPIYKTVCLNSRNGCRCPVTPGSEKTIPIYHAEAVYGVEPTASSTDVEIQTGRGRCHYPRSKLIEMERPERLRSTIQSRSHTFLSIPELVDGMDEKKLSGYRHVPIGFFWPTFYHMALEEFHPGPAVKIIDRSGKRLGSASGEFLKQVTWEGSGITLDGKNIRYDGRPGRYRFYDSGVWGYGAGYGYTIYPYRTIAVNFPGLCRRLSGVLPGCSKEKIIGILLYIKEVDEKRIKMENGIHDGYFCATDTGAPYYIREDRIDMFVGVHGGGNPYLPEERRGNLLIKGGIRNIIPSDWRIWRGISDRVWCEADKIPKDPFHPQPGECTHDYHVVAADSALSISAVMDGNNRPVRCKKRLTVR